MIELWWKNWIASEHEFGDRSGTFCAVCSILHKSLALQEHGTLGPTIPIWVNTEMCWGSSKANVGKKNEIKHIEMAKRLACGEIRRKEMYSPPNSIPLNRSSQLFLHVIYLEPPRCKAFHARNFLNGNFLIENFLIEKSSRRNFPFPLKKDPSISLWSNHFLTTPFLDAF